MEKKDLNDEKLLYNVRETAAVLGVTLMTHTNIDKLHETKVFELKACEDYMRE